MAKIEDVDVKKGSFNKDVVIKIKFNTIGRVS